MSQTSQAQHARHELSRDEWFPFFEAVTKERDGQLVTIEVVDQTYGDQLEAEKLPFAYIEYDKKDDVFIVGVGGKDSRYPVVLRHMVSHPTRILVDGTVPGLVWAIDVFEDDGTQTIVTLDQAPALPPPD
jgi:hypothetical protein